MPKKQWIFDTVVLSNFLLVDASSVLEQRYSGKAIITGQVYDEICSGFQNYPTLKKIEQLIAKKVFLIHNLTQKEHNVYLDMIEVLGKGEASCIARAQTSSSVIVTDDRLARKKCRQLDIPITGTIGILKASVASHQLDLEEADKYLEKMIKAGFYSPVRSIPDIM